MKRILIDANPVVGYYVDGYVSGIGRTTMDLVKALAQLPPDEIPYDICLYSQNLKGIGAKSLKTRFKTLHVYLRNTNACRKIAKVLRLREIGSKYDLQHITHNYEVVAHPEKCVVTLHDAFFMKINEQRFDHLTMRRVVPPFIHKCKHVITCSEYSKKDIVETMGVDPQKITVIPWGIRHDIFYCEKSKIKIRHEVERRFELPDEYYVSVSCNAERKRTDVLIRSYIEYCDRNGGTNVDLVLVWKNPPIPLLQEIHRSQWANKVHFVSGLSDDDLRVLYNCAKAAITPSSYEGFGLPILEAMACGCPVISARNSSLPEVGGDVAIYVDEPIESSLVEIFDQLDLNVYDLVAISRQGVEWAANFTWEKTARSTVDVYKQLLSI